MSSENQTPKVASTKEPGFTRGERDYMKLVEAKNLERVQKLKIIRRNNIITGSLLGCGVLSIYLYSIFAVKQEHFLDDFNEPATVHK